MAKLKVFLIEHGEKIALVVIILLLIVLFFVRRVKVGPIPDLAKMATEVENRIEEADKQAADPREVAKAWESASRDWLGTVKEKVKHPVDDTPAEEFELSANDWAVRARPKAARPGEIEMLAPIELAAEGKRGAVMLKWRGPKEWSFRVDLSDLGIPLQNPDPSEPIEAALYQITNAGVVRIEGFVLSRAASGSDDWRQVNDELLKVLDLVPESKMAIGLPGGEMGPGMVPGSGFPGGGRAPDGRGGAGGFVDPGAGVTRGPAAARDPRGMAGPAVGMAGPEFGPPGAGMMPGGRPGEKELPQVEFQFLDRNVTPENKYVYRVKVVGEVIKAGELPKSEDPNSEQHRNRLKVGDPADREGDPLKEPVEVLSDTMIACMGGRENWATIVVYKWLVEDDGSTQFANERFNVRTGQQIGHVTKTMVHSQQAFEEERDFRGPPGMDIGPLGGREGMRGAGREGMGPMDDPARRAAEASRMRPADDPALRAARAGGFPPGGDPDAMMMMEMPPGVGGPGGMPGRLGQAPEATKKEVDFATGSILLDIVMEATEVNLPKREGTERTTRSPGRRQYKIVVVDRRNLLHDYWKMSAAEVDGQVREFTGGAPIVRRKQPRSRSGPRRQAGGGAGPAAEGPGGGRRSARGRSSRRSPGGGGR